MFGGPPEEQLILLPARDPKEMSRWGAAALDYAVAFGGMTFEREPGRVDFSKFDHVTIVQPDFWEEDLTLRVRQQNPGIEIDEIPAPTPEALNTILNVRVYYGWRYGPRTEHDWSRAWPGGLSLIGLHGRADGRLEEADYGIIRAGRIEAIKLTSASVPENVFRLRQINPDMFIMVRLFADFRNRVIRPDEFAGWIEADIGQLFYPYGVRHFEIHNEPNLEIEGWKHSWRDGREFGLWFLDIFRRLKARFPEAQFGFPGLSPGPGSDGLGRSHWRAFLDQANFAALQADWIGLHAYWVNEREMFDHGLGFSFVEYRKRYPEKLLFITEFGNPAQPKPVVAEQYSRYYAQLRRVKGLGGAFAYIASTSNREESARWAWRDESGRDMGIAEVVGRRRFIR